MTNRTKLIVYKLDIYGHSYKRITSLSGKPLEFKNEFKKLKEFEELNEI